MNRFRHGRPAFEDGRHRVRTCRPSAPADRPAGRLRLVAATADGRCRAGGAKHDHRDRRGGTHRLGEGAGPEGDPGRRPPDLHHGLAEPRRSVQARRRLGRRSSRTADYDSYLKYQQKFPQLTNITIFGGPNSGSFSVEKAVELQPDVVTFSLDTYGPARDSGLIDTLAKVGIPSVIIDFRQQPLETTVPSILLLGRLYGREEQAQAVADFYTQQVNLVFSRVENIKSAPPTAFLLRAAGLLDCCGTFGRANLGMLIERAGGSNLGSGKFPGWVTR